MQAGVAELASFVFFVYCVALALPLDRAQRNRVLLGAGTGVLAAAAWVLSRPWPIPHDWVLPPAVLLVSYWTSGALFTSASATAERRLRWLDDVLAIPRWTARLPRPIAEFLEAAYVSVYPVVGLAFLIHLLLTPEPEADRFWAVILITDFVCFGVLPWVQTRPPRTLEAGEPWRSSVRTFNLRLLGSTSIHVNTFPSGHAAEALAGALLVLGAPPAVVTVMFLAALAIAAGAVLGRYHYAVDAVAGFGVALVVWLIL